MRTVIATGIVALVCLFAGYWIGQQRELDPDFVDRLTALETKLNELRSAQVEPSRARSGGYRRLDPDKLYDVHVDSAPMRGSQNSSVTIVEFSDFQCPYCLRAAPVLNRLLEEYPEDVRLFYKHLPLDGHLHAFPAAIASVAAGRQGKFWEMHDILFANQRKFQDVRFSELASALDLNLSQFQSDLNSPEVKTQVRRDMNEARRLGITGTPVFFINGRLLAGARSYEEFKQIVESEIDQAQARNKEGPT